MQRQMRSTRSDSPRSAAGGCLSQSWLFALDRNTNWGPAREALLRAVKLSPDDSLAHYYLGRGELDAQQYERGFRELELSHQPLPAEPGFLIQVATGYIALGRQDDARKSLERAMSLRLSDAQSVGVASLPPLHPRKTLWQSKICGP